MRYFDAHCHIQFDPYDADRDELIERMRHEEVAGMVVGVDLESSRRAVELAEAHEHLYAAVGLHPNYAGEQAFDADAFRALAGHPKVLAIGECGLDNFRPADVEAAKGIQRAVFEAHVALALETDKPLMIHARPAKGTKDAYRDLIDILRTHKAAHGDRLRGDIHFFVGGLEEARDLNALGFTVSYTAVLTFTHDYDDVVRSVPLTHLITETDAPYVAPASRRGTRNDPLSARDVVAAMAAIRGEDEEVVRKAVLENARRLFGLPMA